MNIRIGYISKTESKAYLLNKFSPISEEIIYTFDNSSNFGPKMKEYTGNYVIHDTGSINFDVVVSKEKDSRGRSKKVLINNQKGGKTIRDRISQLSRISLDSTNLKLFIRFLKKTMREGKKYAVESILKNIEINSFIENNDGKSFLECDVEEKNAEIIELLFNKAPNLSDFSSVMPANFFSCE